MITQLRVKTFYGIVYNIDTMEMGTKYFLSSLLLSILTACISIHGVISSMELTRYILRSQEKPVSSHITVHATVVSRPRHCVLLCSRHPECIASRVTSDSVCTLYGTNPDSPHAVTLHTAEGDTYIHGKLILPLDKMTPISQTIFSDVFLWTRSSVSWLKFQWRLFLSTIT